jgi:RNA 2',3'-cyclic 3'-phosphodiesterase
MRCFLAVDIPEDIKDGILLVQKELEGLDTKLVEKENMHFTLKFLGVLGRSETSSRSQNALHFEDIDEEKMNAVMNRMNSIKAVPFQVMLKGIGFFPSNSFIRMVWIGSQSHEFLNLHISINEALIDLFPKENPVPHLTLARVRSQAYKKELMDFRQKYENTTFGSFEVNTIKLKNSVVTGKGPVYNDVKVWKYDN